MGDTEMRGFIFAVVFILLYPLTVGTIPVDFQGIGGTANIVTPLDPALLIGFSEATNYSKNDLTQRLLTQWYDEEYVLGGRSYRFTWDLIQDDFELIRKHLFYGVWLGAFWYAWFTSINGTDNGNELSFDEINNDAENGVARYSMTLGNGDSAGILFAYWNNTLYPDAEDAFDNDVLHFVHGIGLDATATLSIADLILGLLFWQIPDVPFMIIAVFIIPMYASIGYILWFIAINMIPTLGGG